jgi:starch phosphorylase
MKIKSDYANTPIWKEFNVKSTLPKELECLDEIAHNMWWVWNTDAQELFASLDSDVYEQVGHNPVQLLERLSYDRKEEIVKDKKIMANVKAVYTHFKNYMKEKPNSKRPSVAYFSMEFGIHN